MQDRPIRPTKLKHDNEEGNSNKDDKSDQRDKLEEIHENSQEDLYDIHKEEDGERIHAYEESELEKQIENLIKDKDFQAAYQKLERLKDLNESNPVLLKTLIRII